MGNLTFVFGGVGKIESEVSGFKWFFLGAKFAKALFIRRAIVEYNSDEFNSRTC